MYFSYFLIISLSEFCDYGQLDSEKSVSSRDSQTTHGGIGKKYLGFKTQVGQPNIVHICICICFENNKCICICIQTKNLHGGLGKKHGPWDPSRAPQRPHICISIFISFLFTAVIELYICVAFYLLFSLAVWSGNLVKNCIWGGNHMCCLLYTFIAFCLYFVYVFCLLFKKDAEVAKRCGRKRLLSGNLVENCI